MLVKGATDDDQGPVSISDKTPYWKILWSLESVRLVVQSTASLWNLTSTSAALLPKCLSISGRSYDYKYKRRGFKTLRDLTIKRLIGYWNGAHFCYARSIADNTAQCYIVPRDTATMKWHFMARGTRPWVVIYLTIGTAGQKKILRVICSHVP